MKKVLGTFSHSCEYSSVHQLDRLLLNSQCYARIPKSRKIFECKHTLTFRLFTAKVGLSLVGLHMLTSPERKKKRWKTSPHLASPPVKTWKYILSSDFDSHFKLLISILEESCLARVRHGGYDGSPQALSGGQFRTADLSEEGSFALISLCIRDAVLTS